MIITTDAVFDGDALRLDQPLDLPANTRVRITIESKDNATGAAQKGAPYSFFDVAMQMKLQGPPDWSENLDKYLYEGEDFNGS